MIVRVKRKAQNWRGKIDLAGATMYSWFDNYVFKAELIRVRVKK